jgi:hypothetical protein
VIPPAAPVDDYRGSGVLRSQMPDREFIEYVTMLTGMIRHGFLHRADAVAQLQEQWAMTGAAAEDVLDRMTREREA